MNKLLPRNRWLRLLLGLLLLVVLVLVAWAAVADPITVGRILRHGTTRIDDYAKYPYRPLTASAFPQPFKESTETGQIPQQVILADSSQRNLEDLLESNDSIAFLVIRQGEILYEQYYQDHGPNQISQIFSVSKSVTSALVGAAIQDGLIESLDQPVTDFLPELADQGWDQVTLGQLLSMTSGSDYVENDNPFGEHVIFNYTADLETRILEQRVEVEPGSEWRYKSGDNALLGLILDRVVAPRSLTDYAQEKLWSPLGMEHDGRWSIDQQGEEGLERTWCCLAASARDLAKIGQLYLQDGVVNGQRVLPLGWVAESTRLAFADALWGNDYRAIGVRGYGYQWWLASQEEGDFFALGKDGQYIYVNPATDVVIVRLGWSSGDLPLSAWLSLFQYISSQRN